MRPFAADLHSALPFDTASCDQNLSHSQAVLCHPAKPHLYSSTAFHLQAKLTENPPLELPPLRHPDDHRAKRVPALGRSPNLATPGRPNCKHILCQADGFRLDVCEVADLHSSDLLYRMPAKYHADFQPPSLRGPSEGVPEPVSIVTRNKPSDGTAHPVRENPQPSPHSLARSFMSLFTGPQSTKELSSEPGRRQERHGTEGATSA